MRSPLWLVVLLLYTASTAWAVPGLKPDGTLDREKISEFYFDGEFQKVSAALETFRKQNPSAGDEDRIFVYKYLSVVYAANPGTRDKAESYMYQLLKLVPTATLLDMYVSDNIKSIFKNVREEYEERMKYAEPEATSAKPVEQETAPAPDSLSSVSEESAATPEVPEKKPERSRKWIWWTLGGAAVVAVVVVFIILGSEDDSGGVDINQ
ncbi:hypothetical protein ACFL5V_07405 [Fibrobacterota bacterium]